MAEHDWPNTCEQHSVRPHGVHYSRGGWISLLRLVSYIELVLVADSLKVCWILVAFLLASCWLVAGCMLSTRWFPSWVACWLCVGVVVLLVGS